MSRADCVIVGGGFAGIATARELTRRGMTNVIILEQEKFPGTHSSGRNAGMVRQVVFDSAIAALARQGAALIREAAVRLNLPHLFQETGSLLLGGASCWDRLMAAANDARAHGIDVEVWDRPEVERRVEAAVGGDFQGGVYTRSDGAVDPHALLESYLRPAVKEGARLLGESAVERILVDGSRRVVAVQTSRGEEIETPRVVNAAGAWAARVGQLAGATVVPLVPYRRHLFHTGALENRGLNGSSPFPFLWNEEHQVYLRAESGGLLLSPCDQTPSEPGIPATSIEAAELLAAKLQRAFPRELDVPVARSWAGLRTFAPDGRFVIGPDPSITGFFWVAGLGGHGVTTSAAVGQLAARRILDPSTDEGNAFSPARFVAQRQVS